MTTCPQPHLTESVNPLPPQHVAVIMDGNRRWAKKRGLEPVMGHAEGARALLRMCQAALSLGIRVLTTYCFSTENWHRSGSEVEGIFELIEENLRNQRKQMVADGIRLHAIGNLEGLPKRLTEALLETCEITKGGERLDLVLALNYGGRDELCRAVTRLIDAVKRGQAKEEVDEALIGTFLDTAPFPDPELIVRTSGVSRLSNFLLWQASYSEVVILDTLWPDCGEAELRQAIETYQARERRKGK
ncbi:MAG: polyprenyl diphosphate synthase [Parachlamydiales bacterium]